MMKSNKDTIFAVNPISNPLKTCFIAGLIDGDGFIAVGKSTGEIRIVGHLNDLPLFKQLQHQLGGDIRKETGKLAIRFICNAKNAIHGLKGLRELVSSLNGHIRNSIRTKPFSKLCEALKIQ